jgi:hypothetical protein
MRYLGTKEAVSRPSFSVFWFLTPLSHHLLSIDPVLVLVVRALHGCTQSQSDRVLSSSCDTCSNSIWLNTSNDKEEAQVSMNVDKQVVHIIEEEDATEVLASPEARTFTASVAIRVEDNEKPLDDDFHEALDYFERSTEVSRSIATALVSKETALVNTRLLSIRNKLHSREGEETAEDKRPSKRHRGTDLKQEHDTLWNRALRTRRMNMLLQSLETTQQLLLDELMACADDADLSDAR